MQNLPLQRILFGSPGTGKSHSIDCEIIPNEIGITKSENIIKTVFHPEYTYGDFMGKLIPITKGKSVRYKFYEGHFLRALTQAYKNILSQYNEPRDLKGLPEEEKKSLLKNTYKSTCEKAEPVALVIDEINRGNSSAIFGTVFQLLDRNEDGWSSYCINITEIELMTILLLIGVEEKPLADEQFEYKFREERDWVKSYHTFQNRVDPLCLDLKDRTIRIPPNLSILGTMNTSDSSIFFMDSAFKRRWDWEFINWDNSVPEPAQYGFKKGVLDHEEWISFVEKLNLFIKHNYASIRGIEDKQVGYFFVKERPVTEKHIRNKVMFFLWDSVFGRDKKPLVELLGVTKNELVTFGDFTKLHNLFVTSVLSWPVKSAIGTIR
jgi:5-methylcytosine-specific restriction enzyme B